MMSLKQGMCNKAVEEAPRMLRYVPDNLKSHGMYKKAFGKKIHACCVKGLLKKIYGH